MKQFLLTTFIFMGMLLQAQDNNQHPRVEEMHAKKWQYIVEQAQLTPQEAAAAQPIFMEYEQAVWKIMEKNRPAFFRNKNENKKPDFEEMNDQYVNSEIQKAQLLKTYYQKLKKVVSAETIFKMGKAERSFRNELIKNWQQKKGMRGQHN